MPGLQGQAGAAGEGGHLQQVEDLGDLPPPEQAVGAAGRLGVLPGCHAGHCGCAGEGGQSVGALPYSGSVAGQQAAFALTCAVQLRSVVKRASTYFPTQQFGAFQSHFIALKLLFPAQCILI